MRDFLIGARVSRFLFQLTRSEGNHWLLESETGSNSEIPKPKRFAPSVFDTMTVRLMKKVLTNSKRRVGKSASEAFRNLAHAIEALIIVLPDQLKGEHDDFV